MSLLDSHSSSFIANGRVGPRLRIEDLSYEETQRLFDVFVERLEAIGGIESKTNEEYCRIYCEVLCSYGLMCTHPANLRRYNGREGSFNYSFGDSRWFYCPMCDSFCINR